MLSEKLLAPYSGTSRTSCPANDDFNFFLSQIRIRIEMAFGLLKVKWRILRKPLEVSLMNGNCSKTIEASMTLHNFVINEQLDDFEDDKKVRGMAAKLPGNDPDGLGYWENLPDDEDKPFLEDFLSQEIERNGYERPSENIQSANRISKDNCY